MLSKKSILLVSCASMLSACAGSGYATKHQLENAKYWQRKNSTSALYMQGPKAQQLLHQSIAGCVNEIKELKNLGEIRRAIPANHKSGNTLEERTVSQQELDQWDSPERDGYLYSEHMEYHDFETCMDVKGWERVEYLPYNAVDKANKDYLNRYGRKAGKKHSGDRENVTSLNPRLQNPAPYQNTNE